MTSFIGAVVVGGVLMVSRWGRSLSSGLLRYGKVSLSRALRARAKKTEHGRLKQALVRAGEAPTAQAGRRRHLTGHDRQLGSSCRLKSHAGTSRCGEDSPIGDLAVFVLGRLIVMHLLAGTVAVM